MSIPMPRNAMLFAAGAGSRMRPLTEETAKPLLAVDGRAILDHVLDRLDRAGVPGVVVNVCWQAGKVRAALRARAEAGLGPYVTVRAEETLLESGGSAAAALRDGALGPEPFFLLNGDSLWLNGPVPALRRLAAAFDPARMDALLLLARTSLAVGAVGQGDFTCDADGRLARSAPGAVTPYVFAGVQLVAPALFADAPPGPFSLNRLWDAAIARGRLYGIVHDSVWCHLSRPEDLPVATRALRLAREPDAAGSPGDHVG
ncbi:nucleotidyltransferase family protein [Gluconacetobacter takamatsuzukensis]|uniref:Nucleotidyltransferase family protein n=1 Tax=Gluconacetobacter takamatsuzukensis TaxID=1286190 RepID=A0A7W4PPY1_9PROT|nr:nucleotidyltransferase family protein [Gluconacetobacter takamatsuzukensis]MBB2205718.1 nucleotidyltransferase family protein [Gluconacetobacter takamatsuzukensis]